MLYYDNIQIKIHNNQQSTNAWLAMKRYLINESKFRLLTSKTGNITVNNKKKKSCNLILVPFISKCNQKVLHIRRNQETRSPLSAKRRDRLIKESQANESNCSGAINAFSLFSSRP